MKKDKKNNTVEDCNKKVGYDSKDMNSKLDTNEVTNKSKNNNITDCGK